jgi:hypothetical protein
VRKISQQEAREVAGGHDDGVGIVILDPQPLPVPPPPPTSLIPAANSDPIVPPSAFHQNV